MDDLELIGLEYIWRLVLCSNEEIANRAIDLLRDTFTNLGPRLQANQVRSQEQSSFAKRKFRNLLLMPMIAAI